MCEASVWQWRNKILKHFCKIKVSDLTQVNQTGNLSEVISERSDYKMYMSDITQTHYNQTEAEGLPPRAEACSDVVLMSTVARWPFIEECWVFLKQ